MLLANRNFEGHTETIEKLEANLFRQSKNPFFLHKNLTEQTTGAVHKKESAPALPDMLSSITQGSFYHKVHSQQFTETPRHVLDCVSIEVSGDVFQLTFPVCVACRSSRHMQTFQQNHSRPVLQAQASGMNRANQSLLTRWDTISLSKGSHSAGSTPVLKPIRKNLILRAAKNAAQTALQTWSKQRYSWISRQPVTEDLRDTNCAPYPQGASSGGPRGILWETESENTMRTATCIQPRDSTRKW